ncbi:MAG: hypothetical protein IK065_00800 [Neisseriaceae bacterium]|nr:hypothetical protein [Neisseriaceae bacterium]
MICVVNSLPERLLSNKLFRQTETFAKLASAEHFVKLLQNPIRNKNLILS